jgi:glycosyltransferase involved in cell wall biosynthesis
MIDVMQGLDDRFELDLMLVPTFPRYLEKLKTKSGIDRRIRFLPPVSMEQLVPFSHGYDIGLYLLPPSSFNNFHALPNKFFEFIQARLAVAIGPSPEMARIVREFGCGIVADDFAPSSLARVLNQLTPPDIDRMKSGSDRAARVHTAENNAERMRRIVDSVLKGL